MVDIINFIRNLIFAPTENRKRRAPLEEYENIVSPKIRRINTSHFPNTMEDDWHSTSSSGSIRCRSALHNSSLGTKLKPPSSWSKEDAILNVDEDDDVMEISKSKKPWLNPQKLSPRTAARVTSTPNFGPIQRPSFHQNGDDDVMFLKCTQSSEEKKLNAKKRGFDYIKPFSYVNDKEQKMSNGNHTHDFPSPIFNAAKEIKEKLALKRRPNIPSAVLNQSFRLDEKAKYKSLLAQATTMPNDLRDSFSKYSTPASRLFKNESTGRGKRLADLALRKPKSTAIIDLTATEGNNKRKPRLSTKDTIKKVLSDFDNETVNIKDSDSDVEILPTPPSPKPDIQVERVNSLKKVIDTTERVHDEWLQKLIQKHRDKVQKYQREICAQIDQRNKLGAVASEVHAQRLEEQMVKCLHIKDAVLPLQVIEESSLPELSDEDEIKIDTALNRRGNPSEVVAQKFNLNITRRDIQTLAGLNWLNDEVINFYMNLIIERGKDSKWPKAYAMNTFFYPKLQKGGASSLRRWTRRIDIFAHDLIAVPIHLGVHWCMSIIDFRIKTIKYYDSMGGTNRQCLEALLNYLQVEHLDKKQAEYDISDWSLESVQDIPQQMNGSDCGMFSCTFAEFLTRNAKITFSQEDMPYLRRKMVLEILNGELLIQ